MSRSYDSKSKSRILADLLRSDLSTREFSRQSGVAESTLWKWRKAAAGEKNSSELFIELKSSSEHYEVSSQGVVLKIPATESASRIAELFKALAC